MDRNEHFQRLRQRHVRRCKEGKDRMLDEFCEQHGYHRKHAIKLLGDVLPKVSSQSPPGSDPTYQAARRLRGTRPGTLLCKQLPIGAEVLDGDAPVSSKWTASAIAAAVWPVT